MIYCHTGKDPDRQVAMGRVIASGTGDSLMVRALVPELQKCAFGTCSTGVDALCEQHLCDNPQFFHK